MLLLFLSPLKLEGASSVGLVLSDDTLPEVIISAVASTNGIA